MVSAAPAFDETPGPSAAGQPAGTAL